MTPITSKGNNTQGRFIITQSTDRWEDDSDSASGHRTGLIIDIISYNSATFTVENTYMNREVALATAKAQATEYAAKTSMAILVYEQIGMVHEVKPVVVEHTFGDIPPVARSHRGWAQTKAMKQRNENAFWGC